MGCLEKVIGTILGLLCIAAGIWNLMNGGIGLNTAVSWLFIIAGVLFSFLNAITSYEMFQSVIESITDSAFGGLLSKWFMLALISFGIAYVACGLIFGFSAL